MFKEMNEAQFPFLKDNRLLTPDKNEIKQVNMKQN